MSGQQIGTVVGGVIGAYFGGAAGAQLGMAIGGAIGGAIDPTKIYGPHVGDGQAQSATDGSPISWVMGTAWVAGTIVDLGASREFSVKDQGQGKGSGTETYHYEAHQNFSILVCESDEIKGSTIQSVLMVEQDGKIVYDVRPDSTMLDDSAKYKARNFRLYFGGEDQMPLADYDGDHGVGNEPAYRGVLLAFFTQFNKTAAGGRIPNFRFLVSGQQAAYQYNDFAWKYQVIPDPGGTSTYTDDLGHMQHDYDDSDWTTGKGAFGGASTVSVDEAGLSWNQGFVLPTTSNDWVFVRRRIYAPSGSTVHVSLSFDGEVVTYWEGATVNGTQPASGGRIQHVTYDLTIPVGKTYGVFGAKLWGQDVGSPYRPSFWAANVTIDQTDVMLADIVSRICARGGLVDTQIDISGILNTPVVGYTIAKQMNAVSALGPLLGAHFAYASEYDGKINFLFYGGDAVMTIDEDDILDANDANNGNITENLRNNATEFPKRIIGQYYDPAQNFMPVTVMQTRRAAGVTATGDVTLDIPVAMAADQAQQTVDKALKVAYAQLEGTLDLSVPFAGNDNVYLSLVAGDAVIFRGKRWIVTNPIISNGYIKLTLQYDRQSAYTSDVQAIPGLEPTPPESRYSGPTTLYPMNLPSLRTQDTYGLYLAAKGTNDQSSWRGCNVLVSYDGQQSWQNALTITLPSTLGTVTLAEPSGGEPLMVDIGTGTLESVTTDQLAARMNAFALVNRDTAEIGQFQTAAQQTDGTWQLTTISRGLLGTTEMPATLGQQFTMLDSVYFLPIDLAFAGNTIALRAVGFGENADDQPVVTITYNPDTTVVIDGGEVT